jgi:serine/threonine-protein kinase
MAVAAAPVIDEPPPTSDLIPGTLVGEYKVDKKIGEGGMGAVYSATHPMIGKRAAIKVISAALGTDASAVGRFVQEARSVNQIGHPNIVDVFAFGELADGRNYFVMEYLQGESLAERIQRVAMPLGEAIEILDQVADALEAAHEKQIVHRDLKPDNVYLASVRGGRTMVKLLDFGIAKLSTPDSPGSGGGIAKTRTGMMMGTPGYLSPEQARGKNVDHRTDIYALGCMTFEIACGRLPFVADNAMDIVLMHMTAPPVRASSVWPDIPAPLDDLIARMLEKEATARPSLQEVRAVFSELVSSGLVTLNNGRGIAFGSGIARMQTPAHGLPKQATMNLATGTQPAQPRPPTEPPLTQAPAVGAAPTIAPTTPVPAKSKAPIFAAIAGVLVLGGAGAFFAMKGGGDDKKPTPAAGSDTVAAVEPPKVEPPKVEPPKVEPPKVEEPKTVAPDVKPSTIEVTVNVDGASVTVDGNAATMTGKVAKAIVDKEGAHKIVVSAKGREPFETTVETKSGDTMKIVAPQLEKTKAGSAKKPPGGTTATNTTGTKPPPTGSGTTKPAGTGSGAKPVDNTDGTVDPFAD